MFLNISVIKLGIYSEWLGTFISNLKYCLNLGRVVRLLAELWESWFISISELLKKINTHFVSFCMRKCVWFGGKIFVPIWENLSNFLVTVFLSDWLHGLTPNVYTKYMYKIYVSIVNDFYMIKILHTRLFPKQASLLKTASPMLILRDLRRFGM